MRAREREGLLISNSLGGPSAGWRWDSSWDVPDYPGAKLTYEVTYTYPATCGCADYKRLKRQRKSAWFERWCKHIWAVHVQLLREFKEDMDDFPPEYEYPEPKPTYSQKWSDYRKARTNEKPYFLKLLKELCNGLSNEHRVGRPRLPLSDITFAAVLKVYLGVAADLAMPEINSASDEGYISKGMSYNSIPVFFGRPETRSLLEDLIATSARPLLPLERYACIDSTGFGISRYDRWNDGKEGKTRAGKKWVKVQVISGVKTNVVVAATTTDANANDSPYLADMIERLSDDFKIEEFMADSQYSSVRNLEAIKARGAFPLIPFKVSATGASGGLWQRMYHYYQYHNDEFSSRYHKRSNAETAFHMIKAKFGSDVSAKTEPATHNEVLAKILCHNICCVIQSIFEFKIVPEFFPPENKDMN